MFSETQVEAIVNLLTNLNDKTKIYIGTDSVCYKHRNGTAFAKYATVCVIHMNGQHGCRVFKKITVEPNYDTRKNRPSMRLMNEVYKTCALYTQLIPFIDGYDVEIHCDVNPDPAHGSNCVATEAAGYILGVTGIDEDRLKLKPDAFAASFAGDHFAHRAPVKNS